MRYGLRTMMILLAIVAAGLGFWKAFVTPIQVQHAAEKHLLTKGAKIAWSTPRGNNWLRSIVGDYLFSEIVMVDLERRKIDKEDIAALSELRSVNRLYLASTSIDDDGLKSISGLTKVQRLSLWRTKITDEGLKHLAELDELFRIDIKHTQVTEDGLQHLKELDSLSELRTRMKLTDVGVGHLSQFPGLFLEYMECDQLSEKGFEKISQGFRARTLKISNSPVDPQLVSKAVQSIRPAEVYLIDTPIDFEAVISSDKERVRRAHLTQSISFSEFVATIQDIPWLSVHVTGSGVKLFGRYTELAWVGGMTPVDVSELRNIKSLVSVSLQPQWSKRLQPYNRIRFDWVSSLPRLRQLYVHVPLDDQQLAEIAEANELTYLTIANATAFTHEGLGKLAGMQDLRGLAIYSARLEDEQMKGLSGLHQIEFLDLKSNPISSKALSHISGLENIAALNIQSCPQIDATALPIIARLPNLQVLQCYGVKMTRDDVTKFQQQNPQPWIDSYMFRYSNRHFPLLLESGILAY